MSATIDRKLAVTTMPSYTLAVNSMAAVIWLDEPKDEDDSKLRDWVRRNLAELAERHRRELSAEVDKFMGLATSCWPTKPVL